MDDMISRLVSGIKDRQLDDCTNIIIVSDHGKFDLFSLFIAEHMQI